MAEPQPTLASLAAQITELSRTFTKFLDENNVPAPTFAADSPTSYTGLTAESFSVRQQLCDALMDMWYLTQGPSESIFNYCHTVMPDVAALNLLNYFNFWPSVPLDGSASYEEIAERTSLPRDVVSRIILHAVTLRIFSETEPGKPSSRIQHTSRSAALARSSGLRALVSTVLDDAGAPMLSMNEALQKYTQGKPALSKEMNETAFAVYHKGRYLNSWEFIEDDGEGERKGWRQRNFVEFMRYVKDIFQLESIVDKSLDWSQIGQASVVDVGGSGGHDAVALAQKYPKLSVTVQDLPMAESEFNKNVPEDLKSRVKFIPHNFYHAQPVQADVYMLKMIFHDYTDEDAIKILRAQIPGLRKGAKIIIIEYIGKSEDAEGPALPRSIQQMGTATDLRMMALFNAKERPAEAWKTLIERADSRFNVTKVDANPLAFFAVIETVWEG